MTRKGVLVSVNSDSAELARRLNTEAAKSMKWGGLTEDEALALVTINPAKQLRIDNRVGSLEVGKDADIVVWNHHPLSSYAIADRVYIDGTLYYDRIARGRAPDRRSQKEKSDLVAAGERTARPAPSTEHRTSATRETRAPPQRRSCTRTAGARRRGTRPGADGRRRSGRSPTPRSIRSRSPTSSAARS